MIYGCRVQVQMSVFPGVRVSKNDDHVNKMQEHDSTITMPAEYCKIYANGNAPALVDSMDRTRDATAQSLLV